MAKGPDWNDLHRANPGAVRDAMTEPDIPLDAQPNGKMDASPFVYGRANGGAKLPPAPITVILQDADTLEMETIEWLWLHWLALGKLHLIAGAPEAGKTTIALALAATVSSGDRWPDGTRAPVGNVLTGRQSAGSIPAARTRN
jgi:hypothetical protein